MEVWRCCGYSHLAGRNPKVTAIGNVVGRENATKQIRSSKEAVTYILEEDEYRIFFLKRKYAEHLVTNRVE